jgi:hypothetical protein
MATSEVKNLTGGAIHDCHVKLFIALERYFLSGILNLGNGMDAPFLNGIEVP